MRSVAKLEFAFQSMVGNMKKYNFMFVVSQMLECRKKLVGFMVVEHIAENDYKRTFVDIFGNLMKDFGCVCVFSEMRVLGFYQFR